MIDYDPEATRRFYDRKSETYDRDTYYPEDSGGYPANLFRLKLVQKLVADRLKPELRVLDAGCGTGELVLWLAAQGLSVSGFDISPKMVEATQSKLAAQGFEAEVQVGLLNDLEGYEDQSFDWVFCLGVLPYIPEDLESDCYQELGRVLKTEGLLVSAHENELFDAFTFNRFTLRFFERNIWPLLAGSLPEANKPEMIERFSKLITHPQEPDSPSTKSRDNIFTRPENPLTYPAKLARYGFRHEGNWFYHFHALPPLIRNIDPVLIEASQALEIDRADAWQGLFMASTFVNMAVRQ